jgi:hypothetical protein
VLTINSYCQDSKTVKSIKLSNDSFYLLCRGTKQKVGFIAHKFNLQDQQITHVGIGVVENGKLMIYDVNNDTGDKTALTKGSLKTFIADADLFYWSSWECKSSVKEILKLKKILQSYQSKKIVFDMDFESNNNKFYCSEFCAEILHALRPQKFAFPMSKKSLDIIYRNALNRDVLTYYPVDFFQNDACFKKIYEVYR